MDKNINKPVVIIESPYAGDIARNEKYLKRCIIDSLSKGEAPFASHAIYTWVLNDSVTEDRKLGMDAGFSFIPKSNYSVVYKDYGISSGMKEGIKIALEIGHHVVYRTIGVNEN